MGLRVLKIMDDGHRKLTARLRRGQVDAADPTFAPAANREISDELCKLAGPVGAPSLAEITADTGDGRRATQLGAKRSAPEGARSSGGEEGSDHDQRSLWV
jgi:hypothetical protein